MITIGLHDGMFSHAHSMSAGGGTLDNKPQYFAWERHIHMPITFYTDHCIPKVESDRHSKRKVALLLEAPKFRSKHYEWAVEYEDHFDYILTYHKDLLEAQDASKWSYYPRGGSWVPLEHWKVHPKTGLISFLASGKQSAEGHIFRHEAYERVWGDCDRFGEIAETGYAPKSKAIAPYCYSVVIPGERCRGLFSDHIIDCIALGTVPIYWKAYDIGDYFDMEGIITFETLDELERILTTVSRGDYLMRVGAVQRNIETAKQYFCAEDWLWLNRRHLFESTDPLDGMRRMWQ